MLKRFKRFIRDLLRREVHVHNDRRQYSMTCYRDGVIIITPQGEQFFSRFDDVLGTFVIMNVGRVPTRY